MSEGFKICPYCAEKIKAAAIVCRYCHRDFPNETIEEPKLITKTIKRKILSKEYKVSCDAIDYYYDIMRWFLDQHGVGKFMAQDDTIIRLTPFIPSTSIKFNVNKHIRALKYYGDKSWKEGGRNPEEAIEWLLNNKPNVRLFFGSSYEEIKAYDLVLMKYYDFKRKTLTERYLNTLKNYISEYDKKSSLKNVPEMMHKYIIRDAEKYTVEIEEEVIVENWSFTSEDIDKAAEAVVMELIKIYKGTEKYGYAGFIDYNQMKRLAIEMNSDKFSERIIFLRIQPIVKRRLEEMNYTLEY